MEKTLKQQMNSTNFKQHYYTIYFPAFSAADEFFLSTDKKELEKYYANYLSQLPCPSFHLEDMACCILNLVRTFSNS